MVRKQPEESAPPGAPEWIVTFSDMISLLVTFFVMLMSFSTISDRETMLIVEAFANSRGGVILNPGGPDAVAPPPVDRLTGVHSARGARSPHTRPDEQLLESLEQMGQRRDEEHVELDLTRVPDGLHIVFDESASFAPGSAEVPPSLARSLGELGRVLQNYPWLVVVEGHTDDAFVPTSRYPTPQALGAARASAAAQVLLASSEFPPEALQISGLGGEHPLVDEPTATARAQNRRVELRVLGLSKARSERIEAERVQQEREQVRGGGH